MDEEANVHSTRDAKKMAAGQGSIDPPPNKRLCTDNGTGRLSAGGEPIHLQGGGEPIEEREGDEVEMEVASGEETTGRLSVVGARNNENPDDAALPNDLQECKGWEALADVPFKKVLSLLKTGDHCKYLGNLSQVSTRFRDRVRRFMWDPKNRVGLERVYLIKSREGLEVSIRFFPPNLPFHDITNLDWSRFKRSKEAKPFPLLKVTLTGAEDPVVERVVALLSDLICLVDIRYAEAADLKLVEHLLHASTIDQIFINFSELDENTAPSIVSLASQAKAVNIQLLRGENSVALIDPVDFVEQIFIATSRLTLGHNSPYFFGLHNSFWKDFLDEMLSTGHAESVQVGMMRKTIKRGRVIFTESLIERLKWEKIEKEDE
ncbi:hypothetical protein PMAYCL1PPCAC_28197 [Pristionchus mayeri]|uniref:F-box domain-containing protein n=1 Tax=Pristionchus mayeri TaxID=1317129 RepID=A0AAN5I9S3_9BILA|nr:hypothetical protein PMAYCL1PPCAC_28197 [Pristionchus mayeri]